MAKKKVRENTSMVSADVCLTDTTISLDPSTKQDELLASIFKAIAHPVRVRMLRLISASKSELCACEIEKHFKLRQPTISHHLNLLKNADLIQSRQVGSWVHYKLSRTAPLNVKAMLKKEIK